jgi:hypothetical protein
MGGDKYWCQRWWGAPGRIDGTWTWNRRIAFLREFRRTSGPRTAFWLCTFGDAVHSIGYLYKILDEMLP